ncbi:PqqD family protein [Sphingomicrobium sp. XHP0239]|uniref:PqqD family protein n=1 Tax=Sphingomicrobium maritimum TaxID=3133972 RepID=UPI0031CCB437
MPMLLSPFGMAEASAILLTDHIRQNRSIPTGAVDGELMALDPAAGEVYGLDPTGTRIWNAIGDGIAVETLIEKLADTHDVAVERCRTETLSFLEELVDSGLVIVDRA